MAVLDRLPNLLTRARTTRPSRNLWRSPGAFMSSAQEPITERTSVSFSAVWRAIDLLSSLMASMPKSLVRVLNESNKELVAPTHRMSLFLRRRANVEQTTAKWFECMTTMTILWGQSFSEISGTGSRIEAYPLHPSRTRAVRDEKTRLLYYEYTFEDGGIERLAPDKVLHITTPGLDGITGLGLMELAKQSIGLALALQKYGGAIFGNDAIPGLVLEHPLTLGPEGMKNLRESVEARHVGGGKSHTPLITEEGLTAKTLQSPNDSMQFLETRGFQVQDIARYTGIPAHLLMWLERATFSNIEHQGLEFVKYAIDFWINRFTTEMEVKMLKDPRLQIEIDTTEIERGDSDTFSKVQERRVNTGLITFNEGRRQLGMNTIGPEGDVRVVNSTMMLAEKLTAEPEPEPEPEEPAEGEGQGDGEEPDAGGEGDEDGQGERARQGAAVVLRDALEVLVRSECAQLEKVFKKGIAAGDLDTRIGEFYEAFEDRVVLAFTPAFANYNINAGADMDALVAARSYIKEQQIELGRLRGSASDWDLTLRTWKQSCADEITALHFGGSNDGT
jgi:HK97 family phage portal protein